MCLISNANDGKWYLLSYWKKDNSDKTAKYIASEQWHVLKSVLCWVFIKYILKACVHYTNCWCVFLHFCAHVQFFVCSISTTFVCLLLLTRYIQGAASPKDMLILVDAWVTTSWFMCYSQVLFSFLCQTALCQLFLTGLVPLGAAALCSRLHRSCDTDKQNAAYHLQSS